MTVNPSWRTKRVLSQLQALVGRLGPGDDDENESEDVRPPLAAAIETIAGKLTARAESLAVSDACHLRQIAAAFDAAAKWEAKLADARKTKQDEQKASIIREVALELQQALSATRQPDELLLFPAGWNAPSYEQLPPDNLVMLLFFWRENGRVDVAIVNAGQGVSRLGLEPRSSPTIHLK